MIENSWIAIVIASVYWALSLAFQAVKPDSPWIMRLKADAALALLVALVFSQLK